MNSNFMHHLFVPFLGKQVDIHAPKGRAMIVMDSCGSHLCNSVINTVKSLDLIPVTIRGGFTSYLQAIDTHWTSAYRTVHQQLYDNTTPVMIKRTAAQKRSLLAHLVAEAKIRTHKIVDVRQAFVDCGYIAPHLAKIRIHLSDGQLPYKFVAPDPNADERAADVKRQERAKAAADAAIAATKKLLNTATKSATPKITSFFSRPTSATQCTTLSATIPATDITDDATRGASDATVVS